MRTRSRCLMWVRPSFRTYSYNLDVGEHYYTPIRDYVSKPWASRGTYPGVLTFGERLHYKWLSGRKYQSDEVQSRSTRASSLARATSARAASVPPASSAFGASTGFYARELARSRSKSVERSSSSVVGSCSARATSVPPTAGFGGHYGYYKQQLAALQESSESSSSTSTTINTSSVSSSSKLESTYEAQEQSIKAGRQSTSRAVRRAELHAVSSGRDPRHVGVPRDTSDDICKKVADLRMTPFEGRELESYSEANMRGRLRVQKLEKELSALTSCAMKYKSSYLKSASQMAKEAIEASESEAAASKTMRKTTIVESSRQVAAA